MRQRTKNNEKQKITERSGIASLATILILSAVVVEIALIGFSLASFLSSANFGIRLSSHALTAAQTGIDDAMLRIIRGELDDILSVQGSGGGYQIYNIGEATATVVVCPGGTPECEPQDFIAGLNQNIIQITSTGVAFPKKATLYAYLELDAVTGLVKVLSISDAPGDL